MSVSWTIAQLERNTSELDAEAIEASIGELLDRIKVLEGNV